MGAVVSVFIILLSGCMAKTKQVNTVTPSRDLLYRVKCAACHRLYQPQNYLYQELQPYVIKYGRGLSAEDRQRLFEHLKENAKQE